MIIFRLRHDKTVEIIYSPHAHPDTARRIYARVTFGLKVHAPKYVVTVFRTGAIFCWTCSTYLPMASV